MADNVIKTLTIRGVDETKPAIDGLNKTADAYDNASKAATTNAAVTDSSAKRQLSLADSVSKAERQFNSALRAQQDFEKVQRQMNAAVAQNPALQDRANAVLALAAERYGQASASSKVFAAATSGVSGQLIALSAGAGPVGTFLAAIPGWGLPAAAVVGLLAAAFEEAKRTAHLLAAEAIELSKFAETTGLSTNTLQALTQAAAMHGVQAETTIKSIEKFTVAWAEARLGGGTFLTDLQKIDPALADQIQRTKDVSVALELYTQAVKKADEAGNIAARNQLLRAAGGRGGIEAFTGVANAVSGAGSLTQLTQNAVDAGKAIDGHLLAEVKALQVELDETRKHADLLFGTLGAKAILEHELAWQKLRQQTALIAADLDAGTKNMPAWQRFLAQLGSGQELGSYSRPPPATVNLPLPAYPPVLNTAGLQGPVPAKDIKAQLTDLKQQVELLGSAATANDKLALRTLELKAAVEANATAENKEAAIRGLSAAQLDAYIEKINLHNAALGISATVQDVVTAKMAALQKQQLQGAGLTDAQVANAKRLAQAQADGTFQLQAQVDAQKVQTDTIRMTVAQAETYTIIQTKINENLNALRPELDGVTDSFRKLAEQRGRDLQNGQLEVTLDQARFNARTALLSPLEKEIALLEKRNGINPQTQEIADLKRQEDALKNVQSIAKDFASTIYQGFLNARAGADSLSKGFENLSIKLSEKALEQFMSGDWEKAAVTAIMAVVAAVISLVSHASDLKGTIDTLDRLNQLRLRDVKATSDSNTLAGQLAVFNANAILEQVDEARKGGALMTALIQVQSDERLKIINDFNTQALAADQQAADQRLARQKSAQDRLFAATNDTTTLAGQLAAFDRQADADRAAEVQAGGQALVDLEAAQAAERLNVIKKFNDDATAATKQAAQDQLNAINGAAKNIVDYLTGLTSGPSSTLSPTATLTNAQASYNANLALAQGGNIDAQNKFVSLADNLEKAARAVYASGQGYQDIRSQIIGQGLALPAVQQTTDPVVASLASVLAAINAGNASQALDSTLQNVIKSAIDAGNATAVAALLIPKFDTLTSTTGGVLNFSQFVQGLTGNTLATIDQVSRDRLQSIFGELDGNGNGILERSEAIRAATQGVQNNTGVLGTVAGNTGTTSDRLSIFGASDGVGHETQWHSQQNGILIGIQQTLKDAFVAGPLGGLVGSFSVPTSNSDPVITALRKIVFNTAATAMNTYTISLAGGGFRSYGVFAGGGWVTGGTPGRDSVPIMAMPHEFVVNESATRSLTSQFGSGIMDMINAGRLPIANTNISNIVPFPVGRSGGDPALLAEMKRMNDKIARLEAVIAGSDALTRQTIENNGDKVSAAVDDQTDTLAAQERQTIRQRKVA